MLYVTIGNTYKYCYYISRYTYTVYTSTDLFEMIKKYNKIENRMLTSDSNIMS